MEYQAEKKFIIESLRLIVHRASREEFTPAWENPRRDWGWIAEQCEWHRILGLMALTMRPAESALLPAAFQKKMQTLLRYIHENQKLRMLQFMRVSQMFAKHHIPVIPLKGIPLCHLLYQRFPARQISDIDILIKPEDKERVKAMLAQEVFRPVGEVMMKNRWQTQISLEFAKKDPLDPSYEDQWGRSGYRRGQTELDIHWYPFYSVGEKRVHFSWEEMWLRAYAEPALGSTVYFLDPQDQYNFTLMHAAAFDPPFFSQYVDLALFLKSQPRSFQDEILKPWSQLPAAVQQIARSCHNFVRHIAEDITSADQTDEPMQKLIELCFASRRRHEKNAACKSVRKALLNPHAPLSIKDRFLWVLGYLVPDRKYYGHGNLFLCFLKHWVAWLKKVFFVPFRIARKLITILLSIR